jgi:hypothetical protein
MLTLRAIINTIGLQSTTDPQDVKIRPTPLRLPEQQLSHRQPVLSPSPNRSQHRSTSVSLGYPTSSMPKPIQHPKRQLVRALDNLSAAAAAFRANP